MKIQSKLFFILFAFSILLITTLVLLMQWSIGKGMIEYVNKKDLNALAPLTTQLAQAYEQETSWASFAGEHEKFLYLVRQQLAENNENFNEQPPRLNDGQKQKANKNAAQRREFPPRQAPEFPPHPLRVQPPKPPSAHNVNYALLDAQGTLVVGRYNKPNNYNTLPIMADKSIVGFLAVSKRNRLVEGYELDFIEKQQVYLWLFAFITLVLVLLLTLVLTRHIVVPVKLIARIIHRLTQGHYQQSVILNRQDELGDLNRDCNELALHLAENENVRKRWLADTSHELRTPVAILSGELEAMFHGIRPLNKENIASAMDEVKHLNRLINDLHQLNSADLGGMQYRKNATDLVALLTLEQNKYQTYLASKNINLAVTLPHQQLMVYLDETRFFQLISNILENVIKYAQANLVNITLSSEKVENSSTAVLTIADNGIGVSDEHLAKLFDFLYRVENSRNRETGGSGLGLAICQRIVNAHQGTIYAEKSALGGLAIIIKFPIL